MIKTILLILGLLSVSMCGRPGSGGAFRERGRGRSYGLVASCSPTEFAVGRTCYPCIDRNRARMISVDSPSVGTCGFYWGPSISASVSSQILNSSCMNSADCIRRRHVEQYAPLDSHLEAGEMWVFSQATGVWEMARGPKWSGRRYEGCAGADARGACTGCVDGSRPDRYGCSI
jgi:hypothetical protein